MAQQPPASPVTTRVLRRPRHGRVVLGVAAGLARYLAVDPVLVRIGFIVLALTGGSGVLLYIIGALAIPEEAPGDPVGPEAEGPRVGGRVDAGVVIGAALVVAGCLALLGRAVPGASGLAGPVLLLLAGVTVILLARRAR